MVLIVGTNWRLTEEHAHSRLTRWLFSGAKAACARHRANAGLRGRLCAIRAHAGPAAPRKSRGERGDRPAVRRGEGRLRRQKVVMQLYDPDQLVLQAVHQGIAGVVDAVIQIVGEIAPDGHPLEFTRLARCGDCPPRAARMSRPWRITAQSAGPDVAPLENNSAICRPGTRGLAASQDAPESVLYGGFARLESRVSGAGAASAAPRATRPSWIRTGRCRRLSP